jgi:hypothetical protein
MWQGNIKGGEATHSRSAMEIFMLDVDTSVNDISINTLTSEVSVFVLATKEDNGKVR